MDQWSDFSTFISFLNNQRDVSLVITDDLDQLELYSEQLVQYGYEQAHDTSELISGIQSNDKVFFQLDVPLSPVVREIINQYSTGQINIATSQEQKLEVIHPDYEISQLVLLATSKVISALEKSGYSLLSYVGLTFRSK